MLLRELVTVAKKREKLDKKIKAKRRDPPREVDPDDIPTTTARPDDWRGADWSGQGSQ